MTRKHGTESERDVMNQATEWVAALLVVLLICIVFMFGGVLLTGFAIVCFLALVVAATIDIMLAPFHWLSSRFSFPSGKEKREEE